jgi:galactokinase
MQCDIAFLLGQQCHIAFQSGVVWLSLKMIGTRFGGSVVALAELVAAAETRATEIFRHLP